MAVFGSYGDLSELFRELLAAQGGGPPVSEASGPSSDPTAPPAGAQGA